MGNHAVKDQVLINALDQFIISGTQKQAAINLGMALTTFRSHCTMARERWDITEDEFWNKDFKHKIPNSEDVFSPRFESINPDAEDDIEEYIEHLTKRFTRAKNKKEKTKWHKIKIQKNEPIGLVWLGDPHIDDNGCDWVTLRRDLDIINSHPNIKGCSLGDLQNNWVGRLGRLYANQDTSAETSWKLVEWLVKAGDFLLLVGGNHDLWSGAGDPITYMKSEHTIYEPWDARICLEFPNGRQCKIYTAHDMPGHSQWNPLHAQMKKAKWQSDADLYISGHKHNWALAQHELYDGKIHWLARARGYKFFDDYARNLGLDEQRNGQAIMQVIDPFAEGTSFTHCFSDIEYGKEFLMFLLEKYSDKKDK